MDVLKEVAAYASYVITLATLITLIIKPARDKFTKIIAQQKLDDKQNEQLTEIIKKVDILQSTINEHTDSLCIDREVLKCMIRNNLTHLYYKYTDLGYLPVLERENISYLYEAYSVQLQGNSYVEQCYKELMTLPTR